jgi:hypothetical protein
LSGCPPYADDVIESTHSCSPTRRSYAPFRPQSNEVPSEPRWSGHYIGSYFTG